MTDPSHRAIDHQYLIHATPDAVFRALVEPAWLTRWLCDRAEIVPQKGGRYLLAWTDGPTHIGEIVEFVRGRQISFGWSWPGVALEGTVFGLTVEPHPQGSILRISHTGFPRTEEWTDLYGGAEWGWTYFLLNLKSVLEHGHDLRSPADG